MEQKSDPKLLVWYFFLKNGQDMFHNRCLI